MKIRKIKVHPNLQSFSPKNVNVWYSWNWDAVHLFIRLNPPFGKSPCKILC